MSRVEDAFRWANDAGRAAVVPYFMAGFPNMEESAALIGEACEAGADVVEIGIPYSDPLADGVSIQHASQVALEGGATTDGVMRMAADLTGRYETPLVFMTYYNLLFRFRLERFAAAAADSNVAGVIVPDLPPEEAGAWRALAAPLGIDTVLLLAPTSTDERVRAVARAAAGFVYCVSVTGVTGARSELPKELPEFLARVRAQTSLPLGVGFGVSTPEQVAQVAQVADGVIIGSALVNLIEQSGSARSQAAVRSFMQDALAAARHGQ